MRAATIFSSEDCQYKKKRANNSAVMLRESRGRRKGEKRGEEGYHHTQLCPVEVVHRSVHVVLSRVLDHPAARGLAQLVCEDSKLFHCSHSLHHSLSKWGSFFSSSKLLCKMISGILAEVVCILN